MSSSLLRNTFAALLGISLTAAFFAGCDAKKDVEPDGGKKMETSAAEKAATPESEREKGIAAFLKEDFATAVGHFSTAADQGDVEAQTMLGVCYENGNGVEQDYVQAAYWYQKAADQGDANAQLNLGSCYLYGAGVKKDQKRAVTLFRKAADQGNAMAQTVLGNCYYNGWGVKKNNSEAVKWYRKAATQGNELAIEALKNLGVK